MMRSGRSSVIHSTLRHSFLFLNLLYFYRIYFVGRWDILTTPPLRWVIFYHRQFIWFGMVELGNLFSVVTGF